jgi:hypothetical protein
MGDLSELGEAEDIGNRTRQGCFGFEIEGLNLKNNGCKLERGGNVVKKR